MIRKVVIMVLTLGAVAAAALSLACYWFWVGAGYYDASRQRIYLADSSPHKRALYLTTYSCTISLSVEGVPRTLAWKLGDDTCFLRFGRSGPTITYTGDSTSQFYMIPSWVLAAVSAVFAAYPLLAFIRGPLRRWHRRRRGLCLKCGYDLTGNVSGVCPECGTEIEQP